MTPQQPQQPRIAHMVYFTLKQGTPAAQRKLVEACREYLQKIPGIVFSAVGTPVPDLARPVNVRDFHVGLHIVFTNRKAHDEYQVDPHHQRFVAENKETWQQVRVFDCEV
jgi:Stress responsive A/B Barrel Domain